MGVMADCGTVAGYHAHYREAQKVGGKVECEPCLSALAEDKRDKRLDAVAKAAASFEDALNNEPDLEPGIDVLRELRTAAKTVRAAMRVPKSTRDIAALAKQYAELVQMIAELEAERDKTEGVLGGYDSDLANILRPDFSDRNTGT